MTLHELPNPAAFNAVSHALSELGLDISQGATDPAVDQMTEVLFAVAEDRDGMRMLFDVSLDEIQRDN